MTTKDFGNMSYEEINDFVEELMAIESEDLDAESLRSGKIFGELNRIYGIHSRKLSSLLTQQAKVKNHRWRRYANKWTSEQYKKEPLTEAILKTDIDKYMAIDDQVIEINMILEEQERIVKLIEDSQKRLKDRGWEIKAAIEFRRLIAGQ